MKVLCTGGAGYVGSACLRYLLAQGHDAVAFDNLAEGNAAAVPDGRLIVGDLLDAAAVRAALQRTRPDAVLHFAAVASVPESLKDPALYWRVNLVGTQTLLDAVAEAGVRRVVFSSTAATYAFTDEMPLVEHSPQRPATPYGTSKLAAEHLIRDYGRAMNIGTVSFRYFNASGADLDGDNGEDRRCESHLIPLAIGAALGHRPPLTIFGRDLPTRDGTCVRDYVHVLDLAQAHMLAMQQVEPGEQRMYNLGTGTGTTVLEVVHAAARVVGRDVPHTFAPKRPGDPDVLIAGADAARRELSWKPGHSGIDTILRTAFRWHTSHPRGYSTAAAS